ncbi:MAG: glycosyltransferase [Acidobacteriaceae bacterium]
MIPKPRPHILIVVVLYRTDFAGSETLAGLVTAFRANPALLDRMELLVWDNSPEALTDPELPFAFTYQHAERNDGVAGAYNAAARLAEQSGHTWMLLLDQDTGVTEEFLRSMDSYGRELAANQNIAAVVPFLYAGSFQLSPRRLAVLNHPPIASGKSYIERRRMFAANSGTLMRVSALRQVGGYSLDFWLDHSDIYVFHQFHRHGLGIFVAADLRLQHQVAMLDYDRRMTPERYGNFLAAEAAFDAIHNGYMQRTVQTLRLPIRALRQRRYPNKVYSRMTWRAFWQRVIRRSRWWADARPGRRDLPG